MTHQSHSLFRDLFVYTRLILLLVIVSFPLASCDLAKNQLKADRSGDKEIQDYRDGLAERLPEVDADRKSGTVPSIQPYIADGQSNMKSMPLVSISVNQSIPVRDVLFELAQQADYDLELDPSIRGGLIFTARNRPLDEVVDRISDMAGLRYKFDNDVLRVEVDRPYNKTYKIDYLSYIRSSTGSVSSDVNVGQSEGADSGSQFSANSESESDFWGELESNLTQILGGAESFLRTRRDPRITATEQNPDVAAVSPNADGSVAPPEAVLRVDSLPIDEDDTDSIGGESEGEAGSTFALNKQAGLVSVFATQRQHKEVEAYIGLLRKAVTAQVLIEAKVLEVTLNDQNVTGVDWRVLNGLSDDLFTGFTSGGSLVGNVLTPNQINLPTANFNTITSTGNGFVAGYNNNDIDVLVQALQGFGTVRALASPRLTVLNNQSAVLNVATNQVFFELEVDITQADGGNPEITVESEIRNVPEGVIINVQPSIDLDRRTVSMAVRPTVTNIVSTESDPGLQFVLAQASTPGNNLVGTVTSLIPELNVQQIDSVIQVRSGQAVVMGGLLQDRAETSEEGVPVLSEVPMLGALFKDHRDIVEKTELVIFLKATILDNPGDSVHNTDKDIYRQFSSDRRPFKL